MNNRKSKKETSLEALESVRPSTDVMRAKVAQFIRRRKKKGATDEEVQDALDMNGNTQRPRRWELIEDGFVKDSGDRRLTRALRSSIVWVWVTDKEERELLREQESRAKKKRSMVHSVVDAMQQMSLLECESLSEFTKKLMARR